MLWSLVSAAFLMGLVGGPHCLAMCGSACAGLGQFGVKRSMTFQAGRMSGYALLGAAAGTFVQTLAWASQTIWVLKPAWVLMQAVVMAWGLVLLIFARQPVWVQQTSDWVWIRVRRAGSTASGSFGVGAAWCLLPCGLLYSAVMLSGLSGGAWQGAVVMLAFASATVLWLSWMPLAWSRIRHWRESWGTRIVGVMLVVASGAALWMQVAHGVKLVC
jgi:uncharacterized protein